jgi:hypothetical protein
MRIKIWVVYLVLAVIAAACILPANVSPEAATVPVKVTVEEPAESPDSEELADTAVPPDSGERLLTLSEGSGRVEDGFVKIAGEVKNGAAHWARGIRVDVTLYDAQGKELARDFIYTAVERLAPGASSPFEYIRDVSKLDGEYASHQLDVSAIADEPGATPRLTDVQAPLNDAGYYEATGVFANPGTLTCHNPWVVAAGYSKDGKVYEVTTSPLSQGDEFIDDLAAGQSAPFKLLVDSFGGTIVEVRLLPSCGS